jgi:hypothetical protein
VLLGRVVGVSANAGASQDVSERVVTQLQISRRVAFRVLEAMEVVVVERFGDVRLISIAAGEQIAGPIPVEVHVLDCGAATNA